MAPVIRLLYVDDEPALLEIGKLFLEAGGDCIVDTLESAKEALERLNTKKYDAIISDYQMADMDGIQFLIEVRTSFGQIPFILFTGRGREEVAIKALNAGADFYMQKGGDPKSQFVELIHKVRQAVRRSNAERALWENESRYRTLFQNSLDIIRILDRNGVITYDSLSSEKILGYPFGSLIGKRAIDYVHPDDLQRVKHDLDEVHRKENDGLPTEFRTRKENGDYIWVESVAINLLDVEGVDGMVVTTRPISERKRVEEILRTSEANLKRAEEIGRSGSWEFRLNGNMFVGSEGARILYGISGAHWTIRDIQKIPLPKYRPLLETALKDLLAGKAPYNVEFKIQRQSDGSILDIHSLAEYDPVRNIVFGVIHDITDRKRAEEELLRKNMELNASYEQIAAAEEELRSNLDELTREGQALRESEKKFRSLVEYALESVLILDLQGNVLFANNATTRMLGIEGTGLVGRSVMEFIAPESREAVMSDFMQVAQGHDAYLAQYQVISATGEKILVESIGKIITYEGKPADLISLRDITEQKKAEAVLRQTDERFHVLTDSLQDPVIILGFDASVQYANNAAFQLAGIPPVTEEGTLSIAPFLAPESQEKAIADLETIRVNGGPLVAEYRMRTAQGALKWVEAVGIRISWRGTERNLVALRDITERKKADEALRESEDRFRTILNSMQSGIIIIDAHTHIILDANPKALEMIGVTREAVLGSICHQFICPAEAGKCPVTDLGQTVESSERVLLNRQGEKIAIHKSVTRTLLGGKEVLVESLVDITDHKQAQKLVRESEEKFKSLVEYALEGIFIVDFQGRILFANNAAVRTVGIEFCADAIGRNVMEFIAPESRQDAMKDFMQVAQGHDGYLAHYYVISATGKKISIESIGKVITYEGKPADLISIRDITEQKKAEDALKESEQKHRVLLDEASDPIFSLYPDGTYRYVNRAFAEGIGKSVDQIIGKKIGDVFPKDEAEKRFSVLRGVFASGNRHEFEVRVPRPDGDRYYITTVVPVKDDTGAVVSAICSSKEITARRQVEEALWQANKKLNLLSGVTRHDIRNQLFALNGFLALLQKKIPNPDLEDYFTRITKTSERIAAMIEFTREYEKIGVTVPVWHDCRTIIDTAATQAPLGQVMVKNDLPAGTEIFVDPLIAKVFYNLMDNAARYGGKISTIRFTLEEREGDRIIICEDDGNGIPTEEKERIFGRGYGKNTGLGLAISREILDITGITIRENGEPLKGARFEIIVPKDRVRSNGEQNIS